MVKTLSIHTHGQGLHEFTTEVESVVTAAGIEHGRLALGAWQGIYLWEHRHRGDVRRVVVHIAD